MEIRGISALVTGGRAGYGGATAAELAAQGAKVTLADTPDQQFEGFDDGVLADVRVVPSATILDSAGLETMLDRAEETGPIRAVVHCADKVARLRILDREGRPGSLELFEEVVRVNLVGTFDLLRLASARMARNEPIDGERGVIVLASSIAAYEGQIAQVAFAAAKAGIIGMTLVAARDLAERGIRVCTIAPGLFETPMFRKLPEEARASLAGTALHPKRLGRLEEFGSLAAHIVRNSMLNGETIRLDGAVRMAPR